MPDIVDPEQSAVVGAARRSPNIRILAISVAALLVAFVVGLVLVVTVVPAALQGQILTIVASMVTPAIGTLVTLFFVDRVKTQTAATNQAVDTVHKLVNGQMDAMRKQLVDSQNKIDQLLARIDHPGDSAPEGDTFYKGNPIAKSPPPGDAPA